MRGFTAVWLVFMIACCSLMYMGYLDLTMREQIYAELNKAEKTVKAKNLSQSEKKKSLQEIAELRNETKSTLFFNVSARKKQIKNAEAMALMIEYSQPSTATRLPANHTSPKSQKNDTQLSSKGKSAKLQK